MPAMILALARSFYGINVSNVIPIPESYKNNLISGATGNVLRKTLDIINGQIKLCENRV